jgi:two-component system, OmpR family, phosphate regulon sensor histidine kinase PhoR
MEPVMTCDASAAVRGVSASQRAECDSGDPGETGCRSGASLGFANYEIIVDIGSEASTAYLVRRDSRAGTAATGAASAPWGGDFCAMLLAMVSHDLRQPLQIIMAAHDALEVRLIGEPERRHLERIERAVTQVADRLELLLQALRLRESIGKTELEPVWLNVALEELTGELGDRARQKGIELRISATGAGVWSQSVLLGGVLRNLMHNAIDYTPAGGRVLVGCRRRGPKVRIEVHDSGAGISDEQQAVVFQAFQRGTTTQPGGLGLGLFIVKRAADFLGHHIELRSAAGHGSCFTVIADALAPSGDRRVSPL